MKLRGSRLAVEIDEATGTIASLRAGPPGTSPEYAGSYRVGADPASSVPQHIGDVLVRTWSVDGWRTHRTAASGDTRRVSADPDGRGVIVAYVGASSAVDGIRDFDLVESYRLADDDSLHLTIELRNPSSEPLEIGELSLAVVTNTDPAEIFGGAHERGDDTELLQTAWHEERVLQHLFVAGHGSYALLQRPSGELPALLVHMLGDTPLEAAYQMDPTTIGQWSLDFEGPYYLAVWSRAARQVGRWLWNRERQAHWLNGHTSLTLQPGSSRSVGFRFVPIDAWSDTGAQLEASGQIAVDVAPAMVVPVGSQAWLRIRAGSRPSIRREDDAIELTDPARHGDSWIVQARFRSPGQKRLLIRSGDRWTRVAFFATEPAGDLIRKRARFIVERQVYRNADDPYGRDHAFLPYDDRIASLYLEGEETWQSGGSDEYGLPTPMFLAAKNAVIPDPAEIEVLERYVTDFLLGRLQDPDTLLVRSGRFWLDQPASALAHEWSEERSAVTDRSFNYTLVASIYHSLYRVGTRYGLTRAYTPSEYLRLAWRTAVLGFQLGAQRRLGPPAGFQLWELLDDLAQDDLDGFTALAAELEAFAEHARTIPYPFGSELYTDQTGQPMVYMAMRRFGHADQRARAVRVTSALRCGAQPTWFSFGNDKRGSVCLWYGTGYNSLALLTEFRETGDLASLALGHGGLSSLLALVRSDGAARGWFTWWPDRTGFDARSLDSDMALHSYVLGAGAAAVEHPVFGWVGYGCDVSVADGQLVVSPTDGIRRRLTVPRLGLDITVTTGEMERIILNLDGQSVDVAMVRTGPARLDLTVTAESPLRVSVAERGKRVWSGTVLGSKGISS